MNFLCQCCIGQQVIVNIEIFLCPKSDLENILYDFIRRKSTQNARSHKRKIAFEDTMKEWKSGLGHDFDEKLFGVIVSGRIDRQFAKNVNLACKEGEEKKI